MMPLAATPSVDRRPWRRLLPWAIVFLIGAALAAAAALAQPQRSAVVLHLDGVVGPASSDYLARGLRNAAARGASLVILRMDTPGGLDTSMRMMVRDILASPVPVATFVNPGGARAASAGTYILYGSHIAAMAPGTNLGAATPVAVGTPTLPQPQREREKEQGETQPTQPRTTADAKAISDAVAYIRSLAEMRGRNADWAERAVREAASLSAQAALEEKVIDIVARDLDDLVRQIDGRRVMLRGEQEVTLATEGMTLIDVPPDWRTRLLAVITNPNIALILMMIGLYGLLFEFMNPGALYPGTIGAIALLIAFYALAVLPVNFAGLGLILLGIGLMVAEAFTPSFGILGIGGTAAFVIGATILIDVDAPGFAISWPVIGAVAATTLVLTLVIVRLAFSSHRRRVVTGAEQLIGALGTVQDWRGRSGNIFVHSERWKARATAPLRKGQAVRVTAFEGLVLTVEPAGDRDDEGRTPDVH